MISFSMKLVLDASVAVKWVIPEPDSAKAMAVQQDSQSTSRAIVPDTFVNGSGKNACPTKGLSSNGKRS